MFSYWFFTFQLYWISYSILSRVLWIVKAKEIREKHVSTQSFEKIHQIWTQVYKIQTSYIYLKIIKILCTFLSNILHLIIQILPFNDLFWSSKVLSLIDKCGNFKLCLKIFYFMFFFSNKCVETYFFKINKLFCHLYTLKNLLTWKLESPISRKLVVDATIKYKY